MLDHQTEPGVHNWEDENGNIGYQLTSELSAQVVMARVRGVFDFHSPGDGVRGALSTYLRRDDSDGMRKICVIIDNNLAEAVQIQVRDYLAWCKSESLLEGYTITPLAVDSPGEKTLDRVYRVVHAAENAALRRRDMFVAVGGSSVTDIVGFAAAIYRRSTPWIWIPTDAAGAMRCSRHDYYFSLNYKRDDLGSISEGLLSLYHPPIAAIWELDILSDTFGENAIGSERQVPLTAGTDDEYLEQHFISEIVQYHVASVSDIFQLSNKTLMQSYCTATGSDAVRRKVLIVVDSELGTSLLAAIDAYFWSHHSSIDEFRLMATHVSSQGKDMTSVERVIDAAIQLKMLSSDLFIAVGGGTLMDVVGFAAAMFRGGTPYLRIPTTLVGVIDAGVGVKVGVNFESHKNFIGRYYAPIACLNDAGSFLPTLPRREYACGLAEAVKMAILKSSCLFDVIEGNQLELGYNSFTHEVIELSVRTMLEELQPNLYEKSLIRLVDFGHEFGHIIESLASFKIPHGECVSIGMSISSFLAYLKGLLDPLELERILDCLLSLGLPIYADEANCCDANTLWNKIRTEGIEHKDGMLHLAVPKTIGQGTFIDQISAIDADMLLKTMLALRKYSEAYFGGKRAAKRHHPLIGSVSDEVSSVVATNRVIDKARIIADKESPCTDPESISSSSSPSPSLPPSSGSILQSSPLSGASSQTSLSMVGHVQSLTATVIGASGDIGSSFTGFLTDEVSRVYCTVRQHSLDKFKDRIRTGHHSKLCVLTGHPLDLANLEIITRESDVLYNMAAVVSLSSVPNDQAKVIALNGFGQGIITHFIKSTGREQKIKVVYPSSQRVHLTLDDNAVDLWVQDAARAFREQRDNLVAEQDVCASLDIFSQQFVKDHPIPAGHNVYEVSKRLGEHFVSLLPRHVLIRISGVYGPSFTRGFISRAVRPHNKRSHESVEIRDFIYAEDLNKILLKAATAQPPDSNAFDGASGESTNLKDVWRMARELIGDNAAVVFKDSASPPEAIKLDTSFAKELLQGDFVPFRAGLRRVIDESIRSPGLGSMSSFQHPERFVPHALAGYMVSEETLVNFVRGTDGFHIDDTCKSPLTTALAKSLTWWFNQLQPSSQQLVVDYMTRTGGIAVRLRLLPQIGQFSVESSGRAGYRAYLDVNAGLIEYVANPKGAAKIDDIVGRCGHHLLAFISRRCNPLQSVWKRNQEEVMANKWRDFLRPWRKPYVIVLDIGSTYLRAAVLGPHGDLLDEPTRVVSPSKHSHPQDSLGELQEKLLDRITHAVRSFRATYNDVLLEEVAVAFGGVIDSSGVIQDASIFWGEPARGFDLKATLLQRLHGVRVTILNDVSAAAWRYKDEGRFCLITVSSGLANKVFDSDAESLNKLILDRDGLGGEMGHVVVEPRAVDKLVQYAKSESIANPKDFACSRLNSYVCGDTSKISARFLGLAAKEGDEFSLRLLEEQRLPLCPCGNIADLCSYSSGRAALQYAKRLAAQSGYDVQPIDITDTWLQKAIIEKHPLAYKVVVDSTYYVALRILQLAADLGLEKFIIVGGFALKTAQGEYLRAVQDHLARLCSYSAFFSGWTEARIRRIVKLGIDDDDDVLRGSGFFVQHSRANYLAVEKIIGEKSLKLVHRKIPRCGNGEILAKVLFSGVCSTDLQILRGERDLEPTVLGHEGVCQVVEVGRKVTGLIEGAVLVLLPNNPRDDSEKLGHNREGLFQGYIKFGQEFIDRGQVLPLSSLAVSPAATLIEPLSCVVAAQELLGSRVTGKNVLVIGTGTLGLMFASLNRKRGARNVFLASRSEESVRLAVARGFDPHHKAFTIDCDAKSRVAEATKLEGVDVVIVCVSSGQGIHVAQDAINYVNAGGCVYLFGGFSAGDVLKLDQGNDKEIWSIRTHWKTERVQHSGRELYLAGHRGSRREHVAVAAKLIQDDPSLSNLISHVISLHMVPDVVRGLACDGKVNGAPTKRVVIDMNSWGTFTRPAEDLALRHLKEATMKHKDLISLGNLYRKSGFDGSHSRLGWVFPPSWSEIEAVIKNVTQLRAFRAKRHFIWVGTGAWNFCVEMLKVLSPTNNTGISHTIQSLDPRALGDVFSQIVDLGEVVCLGMSQSGKTLETRAIMSALRERFDSSGLDYREHFIWLTDRRKSVHDVDCGEEAIRSDKLQDWSDVDVAPLTIQDKSETNALFCTPFSVPVFVSLALQLGRDDERLRQLYQQYISLKDGVLSEITSKASMISFTNPSEIRIILPQTIAEAMERLIVQLLMQGWGSKQAGFNPRVHVASTSPDPSDSGTLKLDVPLDCSPAVAAMVVMNALNFLCAMVGYHRGLNFVTHPGVNLYKRRALELMKTKQVQQRLEALPCFDTIGAQVLAALDANPKVQFVDILYYGHVSASCLRRLRNDLTSLLRWHPRHLSIGAIPGEQWNHSEYQAAVGATSTLYIIIIPDPPHLPEGFSKETLDHNIQCLRAIALATYDTLPGKAICLRVTAGFWDLVST
ncbi:3-dehydroquinate synthase [Seiridium cupressi]